MGASLDFGEILEIMREAMRETFDFSRGVLLLRRREGSKKFDFQYRFDSGEITEGDIESGGNEVINWVVKTAKPLIIQEDAERRKFNLPSQISSVLAVPLILSDRVIGIGVLENFALRDVDSGERISSSQVSGEKIAGISSILTTQLALQIQKATLYEKVEKLSVTDGLTQVALRRYFMRRFEEELRRARHYSLSLSFIMIDIDKFKSYNDRYGHLVGDAVLKEIAKILREAVREVDLVGRYGGEEFCIMLPETYKDGAYEVAERIRWLVENSHFKAYDEKTSVTISAGVSGFPIDADTGKELMDKADTALLQAKESGRNRVCKYE
jgi:diguanylate cyclase (GGDEF)-like protein